jgi:hypothetical protein
VSQILNRGLFFSYSVKLAFLDLDAINNSLTANLSVKKRVRAKNNIVAR